MNSLESSSPDDDHVADAGNLATQKSFKQGYKQECKIGEGSFSEVWRCKDKKTGKLVAAKLLKKPSRNAQNAIDTPELIAMRKLTGHPNILHLIESHFDPLDGKVVLIFDLMDSSLYDLIEKRKKPFAEVRAKNYLYQIIKGVNHIHNHGIFHRDIKPENILIKGELLKISDLGSIKGIYNRHPYTEYISTRWYRSPECLITTGYYGPKMDIWAIGCVFYELLTLKALFPGSSEIDQIAKINSVLGTPSTRLMTKFKKHKSRNIGSFTAKVGTGLNSLLPLITEMGRDILKQMLIYDPDLRINVRRLSDHRYFQDYKDMEVFQRGLALSGSCSSVYAPSTGPKYKNPALLSFLTNDRRRKRLRKRSSTKVEVEPDKGKQPADKARPAPSRRQPLSNASSSSAIPRAKRICSYLPSTKKVDARPVATTSLKTGVGSVRLAQPKTFHSNPVLSKMKRVPPARALQNQRPGEGSTRQLAGPRLLGSTL